MRRFDPVWEVTAAEARSMLDNNDGVFFLDVRQPEEFEAARIDGAYLCPLPDLPSRIEDVRRAAEGREIVTVCHHGHRSMQAAAFLREAGLGAARSMAGGIDAWSIHVDPTVPRYGN